MANLTHTLLFTLIGIVFITLIDTVGSIASRKLHFNYGWLAMLSLLVYTVTGYFIGEKSNLNLIFAANSIIGFYDATIGWKLTIIFKANIGLSTEEQAEMNPVASVFITIIVAFFFGYIGFLLSDKRLL